MIARFWQSRAFAVIGAALFVLGCSSGENETSPDKPTLSAGEASASAPSPPPEPYTLSRQQVATFDNPWAMAFEPGSERLFVTEKAGQIKVLTSDRQIGVVRGAPEVDFGGEGGLGDIAFAPDYARSRQIYLSWVEAGSNRRRGAVVGRGVLDCDEPPKCQLDDLRVIWRQTPKVRGRGHYSHRLAFSPDGQFLFVTSGDRHDWNSAQDNRQTLGKIVRLTLDGHPATGNPEVSGAPPQNEIWTSGHRNPMGMAFDHGGRLWVVEHGPVGGDELNLIEPGQNFGWPIVSEGEHNDGVRPPRHSARVEFTPPVLVWDPVIAPGGMIILSGRMFPAWKGQALITGLRSRALVRVELGDDKPKERERYPMPTRMRAIAEGPDGAIWIAEEGPQAKLYRLTPES